jgi:hypothetical protein
MSREGYSTIPVTEVSRAEINFRTRASTRHELQRLAAHVHDRVETRAGRVDLRDQPPA